jgi:hypothetical protein
MTVWFVELIAWKVWFVSSSAKSRGGGIKSIWAMIYCLIGYYITPFYNEPLKYPSGILCLISERCP